MQQTEKYKLNLIEPSDPFLPEGLNENTQKVEEVLQTHMEGPLAELDQRVTVLEGHRFACGYLRGISTPGVKEFVELGFRPKVIFAHNINSNGSRMSIDAPQADSIDLVFADTGFWTALTGSMCYFAFD